MKRIAVLLAGLLVAFSPSFGQSRTSPYRGDVYASYGVGTVPDLGYALAAVFGTIFTLGYAKADKVQASGALAVGADFHVVGPLSLGCLSTYERIGIKFDSYETKDDDGNIIYKDGRMQMSSYICVMPTVKLDWLRRESFSMYSRAGFGVAVCEGENTTVDACVQLTLAGCDFGRGPLKGFAEIGAGYQGLLTGGLKYSF